MTKQVKCVVWDLDDTVWQGTLLEGGGGELYPSTRSVVEELDRRGILQSIASKNHHNDAMERLRHFGLEEYFLYPQIHFGPKSQSMEAIAKALNISIDSLAFVDDQPFEREEVQAHAPGVRCYLAERLPELPTLPEFTPRFVTEDSAMRRKLYQTDMARAQSEEKFDGPKESFLAGLNMVFTIAPVGDNDLQRAVDLTERTNQLNATGITYSHDDLDALRRSDRHLLHMAALEDKFGPYGKIGLSLVEIGEDVWTIRLLLMSCRVMARGVGGVMLSHIVRQGLASGKKIQADFVETGKNRMMYVTYKFAGFEEIRNHDNRLLLEYTGGPAAAAPSWLKVVLHDAI